MTIRGPTADVERKWGVSHRMKHIQDYKNGVLKCQNGLQMKGRVHHMTSGNRTQTHGIELGVQGTPTFSYQRAPLTNEYMNTGTNE